MLFTNGGGEFTVAFLWHKTRWDAGRALHWTIQMWHSEILSVVVADDRPWGVSLSESINISYQNGKLHPRGMFHKRSHLLKRVLSVRALFSIPVRSPVEPKVASPLTKSIGSTDPPQLQFSCLSGNWPLSNLFKNLFMYFFLLYLGLRWFHQSLVGLLPTRSTCQRFLQQRSAGNYSRAERLEVKASI